MYGDMINAFGWSKVSHIGEYIPAIEGYEDSFSDWENKVKGEYPYQMFTPHYLRRVHTNFDNVTWLREACEIPLFINAFRIAHDLAMAMEARCYRGGQFRTRMNAMKFGGNDVAACIMLTAFLAIIILMRIIL